MKFSILYSGFFSIIPSVRAKMPHFLFAGQSNMVGHGKTNLFDTAMNILFDEAKTDDQILADLKLHFYSYPSSPSTSADRYDSMAVELMDLKSQGILSSSIQDDQTDVTCSFYELQINNNEASAIVRAEDANLSPYASCGKDFGPELMFGSVMDQQLYGGGTPFAIDKIAAGGSEIEYHWSKDIGDGTQGKFWDDLVLAVGNINQTIDYWAGIAWFQGENEVFRAANSTAESWSDEEQAEIEAKVAAYEQNLREFVRDLRQEVFDVDSTVYSSPADIPFAIIQIGCWIQNYNDNGLRIAAAQKAVADEDPNIVLIDTNDYLSCHYHYDDPSHLIIGHRLATEIQTLIYGCNDNGICEDGENCYSCPSDCAGGSTDGAVCGDGVCHAGNDENCVNCPQDCNGIQNGRPNDRFCCGDGGGYNPVGCALAFCGNSCTSITVASFFCCGNKNCEVGESCSACALDCEGDVSCQCGNSNIDSGEECDLDNFAGTTCEDFGCTGGSLTCVDCKISASSCTGCGTGCVPTHEKEKGPRCSDGIDNDCDGVIDGDDPDCRF